MRFVDKSTLDKMWKTQQNFNQNFVDFQNLDFETRQSMTKEYVLHLLSETNSLLDTVNWKMHHKKSREVNREDVVLEIIDTWKYLLSICLLWDVTPEEFCKAFDEKSALVEQRFLQEFANYSDRKVVICDIDGVLSDYPYTFLSYVEQNERLKSHYITLEKEKVDQLDLYKYLSGVVSTDDLRQYKHKYRSEGLSRTERVLDGSKEFLSSLRKKGYYVVLLTSRPFDTYKSLYLDTYSWLRDNGLEFDMLLSDSKKRSKVSDLLKTTGVEFVIDDDPRLVANLEGLDGLKRIYLVDRPYNSQIKMTDKVVRIKDLSEIVLE